MWSITPEAVEHIKQNGGEVTVEEPISINNCCIEITEAPAVHLGKPRKPGRFKPLEMQGILLNVPADLVNAELRVDLSKIFWHKRLVVEGWKMA